MALHSIKNYKQLMSVEQLILENKEGWSLGMISEIMSFKQWMTGYLDKSGRSVTIINKVFGKTIWEIHQKKTVQ